MDADIRAARRRGLTQEERGETIPGWGEPGRVAGWGAHRPVLTLGLVLPASASGQPPPAPVQLAQREVYNEGKTILQFDPVQRAYSSLLATKLSGTISNVPLEVREQMTSAQLDLITNRV